MCKRCIFDPCQWKGRTEEEEEEDGREGKKKAACVCKLSRTQSKQPSHPNLLIGDRETASDDLDVTHTWESRPWGLRDSLDKLVGLEKITKKRRSRETANN